MTPYGIEPATFRFVAQHLNHCATAVPPYKGNNGSKKGAGRHRHNREKKTAMVWPHQKDARGQNTKINYGMDTMGEKEKWTSKKNVDGRSKSSHNNKKLRTRSIEKQRGMAFGFRKTATAVKKPDR